MENPWYILLAKQKTWKHVFNTNSKLSQNRTQKEFNWLFNDVWCLVIGCFNWKMGVFQQAVVADLLYS